MTPGITTLTSETFDEVVGDDATPILVDFWAGGCAPCVAMLPVLEDLADRYADKLRVGKLRLDDASDLARRFEIKAVPTLVVFVDGKPVQRVDGAVSRLDLLEELQWLL